MPTALAEQNPPAKELDGVVDGVEIEKRHAAALKDERLEIANEIVRSFLRHKNVPSDEINKIIAKGQIEAKKDGQRDNNDEFYKRYAEAIRDSKDIANQNNELGARFRNLLRRDQLEWRFPGKDLLPGANNNGPSPKTLPGCRVPLLNGIQQHDNAEGMPRCEKNDADDQWHCKATSKSCFWASSSVCPVGSTLIGKQEKGTGLAKRFLPEVLSMDSDLILCASSKPSTPATGGGGQGSKPMK